LKIERTQAKTLIRTSNRSPHHIHFNIYQGCYHNCVYCNGFANNYNMHDDFGEKIKAKINAPELFEKYLIKEGYYPIFREGTTTLDEFFPHSKLYNKENKKPEFLLSLFGNVCDIYQPAEKELQLTRKLLQIAYEYGIPVRLLTKNDLVLRDLDLIKKIHKVSFARVAFTITLINEENQRIFEPRASSSIARLHALKKFREEGIPSGVYITPVIPFIGDTEENLNRIYGQLKSYNSEFVITGGLTLKPGRNKERFMQVIRDNYPHLYSKFNELYSNNNRYGQPNPLIAQKFNLIQPVKRGYELAHKFGLNYFEPRYIPNVKNRINLTIATYLARIGFIKNEISQEDGTIGHEFRKAASVLEYLDTNISLMSNSDFETLQLSSSTIPIIKDIIKTGKCNYLEQNGDFGSLFV